LKPKYGGKYLVLGSSAGYVIALLSFIVSDKGMVYSVEKYNLINEIAKRNLAKYPKNIALNLGNVEDGLTKDAPYDGIISIYPINIEKVQYQLTEGGILIVPSKSSGLISIERNGGDFEEEIIDIFD
jgi:protein-L-isoaspartate O-methyltransferase